MNNSLQTMLFIKDQDSVKNFNEMFEKKEQKKLRFIANIHHLAVLRRAPQNRGKLNRLVFGVLIKIIPNKLWDRIQTKSLNKIINYTKTKNMIVEIIVMRL